MPCAVGVMADSYNKPAAAGPVLTGLQMWLDADDPATFTYNTGAITQWADKSGNNRHATQSGQLKPTRVAAAINGRAAVYFQSPSPLALYITAFAQTYTAAEIFVVLDLVTENDGGYLGLWGTSTNQSHYPTPAGASGVVYESWGTTVRHTVGNPTIDLLSPHIYNLRTAANSYIAAFNGTDFYTSGTNTVGFRATDYQLGIHLNPPNGYMGEVVMYNRVLAAGERTTNITYLKTKWGIA